VKLNLSAFVAGLLFGAGLAISGLTQPSKVFGFLDVSGAFDRSLLRRAAVIAKELAARGVPENEITSIGMGADKPLVSPDNTAAKKAKNRRYEIQVRL
jgi:OmpA-OmpF porin, OOP family